MPEKKEQKPIFIESEKLLASWGKREPGYGWIIEDSDNREGGFKEVKYSTDAPGNFRRIIIKNFDGEPIAAALIESPKTNKAKVVMLSINKEALKIFDTAAKDLKMGIEGAGATIRPLQVTKDTYVELSPIMTGNRERLSEGWLTGHKKGKPGITKERAGDTSYITYRDEKGLPVGAIDIDHPNTPQAVVDKFYIKKGHAGAIRALTREMETAGATENLPDQLSRDSASFYHHYQIKKAVERGEAVPEEVLKDYPSLYRKAKGSNQPPVATSPAPGKGNYREELPENNVQGGMERPEQLVTQESQQKDDPAGDTTQDKPAPEKIKDNSPGYIPGWEKSIIGEEPKEKTESEEKNSENDEEVAEEEGEEDDSGDNNFGEAALPSEEEMEGQVTAAGAREKVSPMDPDFLLILFFALIVDILDIILEILAILVIPKLIGIVIDLIVFAIIGGWMSWRTGKVINAKKQQQEKNTKIMQQQMQKMQKLQKAGNMSPEKFERYMKQYGQKMGKSTQSAMRFARSTFGKRFLRAGLVLLSEIIPFLGIIPFWTITVVSTLREE